MKVTNCDFAKIPKEVAADLGVASFQELRTNLKRIAAHHLMVPVEALDWRLNEYRGEWELRAEWREVS